METGRSRHIGLLVDRARGLYANVNGMECAVSTLLEGSTQFGDRSSSVSELLKARVQLANAKDILQQAGELLLRAEQAEREETARVVKERS